MLAVRSLARIRSIRQRQAEPMRAKDRDAMVAAFGSEGPEARDRIMSTRDIRDAALICTRHDGLFRREEMIGLRTEDLELQREGDGPILPRQRESRFLLERSRLVVRI